jgi:hypothetical protein
LVPLGDCAWVADGFWAVWRPGGRAPEMGCARSARASARSANEAAGMTGAIVLLDPRKMSTVRTRRGRSGHARGCSKTVKNVGPNFERRRSDALMDIGGMSDMTHRRVSCMSKAAVPTQKSGGAEVGVRPMHARHHHSLGRHGRLLAAGTEIRKQRFSSSTLHEASGITARETFAPLLWPLRIQRRTQ